MLELYHHGSSACAAKVRLALAEKSLEWLGHYVDILRGEQFDPRFLELSPKAVVPVLVHDGAVIRESTVICEYLEEAFPEHPIYPRTPLARAQVRIWTKAVDEDLHPACSALTYVVSHRHTLLRNGVGSFEDFLKGSAPAEVAARTLKWQWIQQGLAAPGVGEKIRLYDSYMQRMEAALAHSQYLVGDRFSMADIAMAPYVNRLAALGLTVLWHNGRLPNLEGWFERLCQRPTFGPALVEWVPGALREEMRDNGRRSCAQVMVLLAID
ncbi:MAG: glutathione S-transferase N-terminal domain-containing protein [Steroidobacteraceae bacterium]